MLLSDSIMYGKVFKNGPIDEHKMAVYVSFRGLLMKVVGGQRHLSCIELDVRFHSCCF